MTTAKAVRSVTSSRRRFCVGVVKVPMPFAGGMNVVLTVTDVVLNGEVKRYKHLKLHPVDRKALTPMEIAR